MKKYNLLNDLLGWFCFVIAAVTYLLTIEPTASFWDCPEFISQGAKLEVGHPPGNPIFMLTARFFVTIFGNNIANAAIAVNSMSALLSAATILLLFWTITHLIRRLIVRDDAQSVSPWQMALIFGGGLCGALAYTWSDTFWFSAVEGEVYAFSSFCTALVFWLILKWENRADNPHSDRYLIFIAYIIGVSVAVHLLNLLCIPAIVLVYYFKKTKNVNAKGSLLALLLSFVIVGLILYGLVPGFVMVAQWFELFFVNSLGFSYNMGVVFYTLLSVVIFIWAIVALKRQRSASSIKTSFFLAIALSGMLFIGEWWVGLMLILALGVYLWGYCKKIPVRVFNVIILSVFLIFVGYSSYALLLIRSTANTPMNQNAPDNVFALGSYLNREQYGDRPLFKGAVFGEELVTEQVTNPDGSIETLVLVDNNGVPRTQLVDNVLRDQTGSAINTPVYTYARVVKSNQAQSDKYVKFSPRPEYTDVPELSMLFTRMYSPDPTHVKGYKDWSLYEISDLKKIPQPLRQKWAEQGFAPYEHVKPYLNSQIDVTSWVSPNGNPVRTFKAWKPGFLDNLKYFFNYQFAHMYWRYFMWNFAGRQNDFQGNGEPHLGNWISGIPVIDNARLGDQSLLPDEYGKGNKGHNVFYMLPLLLGIIGLLWQALYIKPDAPQRGIEQFWVICFLFLMTGIAIVLYLNQPPGQPRERDYAFAGSFYAFAIWIGIGVPAIGMMLRSWLSPKRKNNIAADKNAATEEAAEKNVTDEPAAKKEVLIASAAIAVAIGLFVPIQMVSQTWDDHDRSGRYTARDFGFNYLASVEPNGIIFCNGDNDTFPLWYAQEVEGYRTDVRVVNLSYLSTDWYANQQKIPSYDAKPISMYATPADYSYDRFLMGAVYPVSDSLVTAEYSLRQMYNSGKKYGTPYPIMTYTNMVMPVDTAVAIEKFGLNPNDKVANSFILPYLSDININAARLGRQNFGLGNFLTLDIVANSVAGGFERPVYIASTVPSSNYMGLSPYLSSTGMAYQVTPFYNAPVSPTLDKAYENIMGEFRWGGLDAEHPENLYLDETVKRMLGSMRHTIYQAATQQLAVADAPATAWAIKHAKENGLPVPVTRADMARILLNTNLTKLPAAAAPYDGYLAIWMAEAFYDLYLATGNIADLDAAQAILDENIPRFAQLVRYANSLSPSRLTMLGSELSALRYLGSAVGLKNRISVMRKLMENPAANAEIIAQWAERDERFEDYVASLLYVYGYSRQAVLNSLEENEGNPEYLERVLLTIDAHDAAGVKPLEISEKIMTDYGMTRTDWQNTLAVLN